MPGLLSVGPGTRPTKAEGQVEQNAAERHERLQSRARLRLPNGGVSIKSHGFCRWPRRIRGHDVARSTVAKVLKDNGIGPAPDRPSSWRTFLRAPLGRDRRSRLLHQRGLVASRAGHLLHALCGRSAKPTGSRDGLDTDSEVESETAVRSSLTRAPATSARPGRRNFRGPRGLGRGRVGPRETSPPLSVDDPARAAGR